MIVAIPKPRSFGYWASAFMILDADVDKADDIGLALSREPQVMVTSTLINASGLISGVQAASNDMLYKFIKDNVSGMRGIRGIETLVTAELKKRYYGWLIEEQDS